MSDTSMTAQFSNTLGAPLACFDEGFSSEGGLLSGAETDRDVTPTDHDSDLDRTPKFDLPRTRRPVKVDRSSADVTPEGSAGSQHSEVTTLARLDSGQDHTAALNSDEECSLAVPVLHSAPKDPSSGAEEELMEANLLFHQESFDGDLEEFSLTMPAFLQNIDSLIQGAEATQRRPTDLGSGNTSAKPMSNSLSTSSEETDFNRQIRKQYETRATTRPRSTTPVRSSVLEEFVSAQETHQAASGPPPVEVKMKICLPGEGDRPSRSRTRRRSSLSWSEFQENMMIQSQAGRTSGRTTPQQPELPDLLDQNADAPPCPVNHRKTSVEWVMFTEEERPPQPPPIPLRLPAPPKGPPPLIPSQQQQQQQKYQKEMDTAANQSSVAFSPTDMQPPPEPTPIEEMTSKPSEPSWSDCGQTEELPPAPNDWNSSQYYNENVEMPPPPVEENIENPMEYDQYQYDTDVPTAVTSEWDQYGEPQPSETYQYQQGNEWTSYDQQPINDQNQQDILPNNDTWESQTPSSCVPEVSNWSLPKFAPSLGPPVIKPPPILSDLANIGGVKVVDPFNSGWDEPNVVETSKPAAVVPPRRPPPPPPSAARKTVETVPTTEETVKDPRIVFKEKISIQLGKPAIRRNESTSSESSASPDAADRRPVPTNIDDDEYAPPPGQTIAGQQGSAADAAGGKSSSDWEEFQKMTQRCADMMKKTQERLQEMQKTSAVEELSKAPKYMMKPPTPPPVDVLLGGELPAKPEGKDEWRPVADILNEEIHKQKELSKPHRPPPPKPTAESPQRPPPPKSDPTAVNWDSESPVAHRPPPTTANAATTGHTVAGRNLSVTVAPIPSWDDDAASYYASVPSYAETVETSAVTQPTEDTSASQMSETVLNAEEDASIPGYTGFGSNIDYPSIFDNSINQTGDVINNEDLEMSGATDYVMEEWKGQPDPFDTSAVSRNQLNQQSQMGDNNNSAKPKCEWADDFAIAQLPDSQSDFFSRVVEIANRSDPFGLPKTSDPFAANQDDLLQSEYDPFEQIVAEAKAMAAKVAEAQECQDDIDFFALSGGKPKEAEPHDNHDTMGFEDSFGAPNGNRHRPDSPLFDEDDSHPLPEFPLKYVGDGWDLMLRYPVKKKMMAERYWKPVVVRLASGCVQLFNSRNDKSPFQELPLQANYCLSDVVLQQYDAYGKIHTVKLQYVVYKEKVGIRPGQIPKLMEGRITKLGLPLEHSAQSAQLLKLGSLSHQDMDSFVRCVEDLLFQIFAIREASQQYKQDEIQVHVYDEYSSHVDKIGVVSDQRGRVRVFCLAFISGMSLVEIGLNDRRRQGKEIVRRKDIMPMYTERWIRLEALELHSTVGRDALAKDFAIRLQPLDATFFEVLRFRVRPPKSKELPLLIRCTMRIAGSKIEIRIECTATGFRSRKARQVPCEDIQIRFPIPEAWIYLFREERHWGYGSIHAQKRRPGKIKNLKDRLMGVMQNVEQSLIEVAIGEAKYEHVYRSLVWRIPMLPEKHHGAYKTHLLRCRFQLSSFDLMPETFVPNCEVDFTMPIATVSHTVVRSVSIEQHEDPDAVEKWVRYVAKYHHQIEIDYVQSSELDLDAIYDPSVVEPEKSLEKTPVMHRPSLDMNTAKECHEGYRIDFSDAEFGGKERQRKGSESSSDGEPDSHKAPMIRIDMKGFMHSS